MPSSSLHALLQAVADQRLTVEQALEECRQTDGPIGRADAMAAIDGAVVDLGRQSRCRFGEVIYGEGKSPALIESIARTLIDADQSVLVTRVSEAAADHLQATFPHHRYSAVARTIRLDRRPIAGPQAATIQAAAIQAAAMPQPATGSAQVLADHVAVVTAGSTDYPVAAEAIETLGWMGVSVDAIEDVGVAGPQRLLAVVPRLRAACAVVVCAGMEGALPSVVGGHVGCPVIAVPTSVGYGSALGGMTAMLGMLTSCASNVTVVGIDAGFKAGYVSGLIASQLAERT